MSANQFNIGDLVIFTGWKNQAPGYEDFIKKGGTDKVTELQNTNSSSSGCIRVNNIKWWILPESFIKADAKGNYEYQKQKRFETLLNARIKL
jgi:hypothetical protein